MCNFSFVSLLRAKIIVIVDYNLKTILPISRSLQSVLAQYRCQAWESRYFPTFPVPDRDLSAVELFESIWRLTILQPLCFRVRRRSFCVMLPMEKDSDKGKYAPVAQKEEAAKGSNFLSAHVPMHEEEAEEPKSFVPSKGLTTAEAQALLAKWGRNELEEKNKPKVLSIYLCRQFIVFLLFTSCVILYYNNNHSG